MGQTLSGFKKSEFLETMNSNPMKIQVNEKSPENKEADAPEINEAEAPETNEVAPLDENKAWTPPDIY